MSPPLRAKLSVCNVKVDEATDTVTFTAVAKKDGYTDDGLDEDNTFAMYSPGATLVISIANPALWGKFKHGDKFYVDFTPAPEK